MNRFKDKNLSIYHFEDEVFIECPKCDKRAIITKNEPESHFSERTLKCPNCFHSQKGRKESYSIELNCHCPHCAGEIKVDIPNVNEKKETISVKCSNCGKTEDYKPRNISQEWAYQNTGKPSDSYFGLPLWLSVNFRGNSFWALNYQHLEYLKDYISADLREKNGRNHWTMVEKLPDWMKSGKNRDKIVKLIAELEKK
ncbi:hypothetical protein [Algibacter sp. L4_22]|uniref:hypothetical protein n=1 Tax=Algibacter sp. L4_22 TaxID=2942477 RepID=UPI00201B7456|nr:hypothetical protein [Algibacter sp. L4_22]MCL5130554.1 hypothetical protein [Algibacter sp. L4_22]